MKGFRSQHFTTMHIVVALISRCFFKHNTYVIRHGLTAGMRRKGGLGFLPFGPKETAESDFLRRLQIEDKVIYDIGAFEGVLTLFFARRARSVVAYEPNPANYFRCRENVRLNELRNVEILNRGISDSSETIELTYDPLMPGAGSADDAIALQIGGSRGGSRKLRIPAVSLDDDILQNALPQPDLIKIDVEGMELRALNGMRRTLLDCRPELFIEMHGATAKQKVETAHAVVNFLETHAYRIFDVERGGYLTSGNLGDQRPGHLYCAPLEDQSRLRVLLGKRVVDRKESF